MKIYALNGIQEHRENVKNNEALHGGVVLRGVKIEADGSVQLLESSRRIARAIEQKVPVTVVLFGGDETVTHDCGGIVSEATGLPDRSTARELAGLLLKERSPLRQAVYESGDCPNVKIVDAGEGNGRLIYMRLTHAAGSGFANTAFPGLEDAARDPSCAFPEKVRQILFAEKDISGQRVLAIGNGENRPAAAFRRLGAEVEYTDLSPAKVTQTGDYAKAGGLSIQTAFFEDFRLSRYPDGAYDIVYAANDVSYAAGDLPEMYGNFKRVLKPGGLLVTLDTHPFMNLFAPGTPGNPRVRRAYDDITRVPARKPENKRETGNASGEFHGMPDSFGNGTGAGPGRGSEDGPRFWRISDMSRCLLASGLRPYALLELQADYDAYDDMWYSSVRERLDDLDVLSDWTQNPLAAVPRWLAAFAYK